MSAAEKRYFYKCIRGAYVTAVEVRLVTVGGGGHLVARVRRRYYVVVVVVVVDGNLGGERTPGDGLAAAACIKHYGGEASARVFTWTLLKNTTAANTRLRLYFQ